MISTGSKPPQAWRLFYWAAGFVVLRREYTPAQANLEQMLQPERLRAAPT